MLIGIDASRAVGDAPTGTETYSRELIRALLSLDHENSYRLYMRSKVARDHFGSTSNFEIRAIPFPRAWTHARLSLEMLTHMPDLLWVPAHVLPLVHPRRSIVTIHDLGNLYFPEAYPAMQRGYHRWSQEWNVRAASHIFADSQATKNDLVKFLRVGSEKISVVYPAYDVQSYQQVRDQERIAKTKARFRIGRDYLIAIGTIHPRKNYARLIEAFEKLSIGNCQLIIVGKKGWLYREILVESEKLRDRVIFLDYVPRADMPALISGARLFVFPSLHEGFGLPILEAQACGVPVACSNMTSLPEVAGDAAIFFDPLDVGVMTDAIRRGLSDERLRAEMIARGFENVKRFAWDKSARTALDVMNQAGRNA